MKYECTAISIDGDEKTAVIEEWWYDGEKVESIEATANDYFYTYFDKASFEIIKIVPLVE